MDWSKFESDVCSYFFQKGYWAHKIAHSPGGSQPFDIIAIKRNLIVATDCKVCSRQSFPLVRVEDNQWLAMELMTQRTDASVGFACYFQGRVYWLPFSVAKNYRSEGKASVPLASLDILFEYDNQGGVV